MNNNLIDELISDIFIEIKTKFIFMNINDQELLATIKDISKKIKEKNIKKAKNIILKETNKYYLNKIKTNITNNNYNDIKNYINKNNGLMQKSFALALSV